MGKRINSATFGTFTMIASAFLVKILGFLYKVPLSHMLGDEGMGYYNSALTVYAIFYILTSSAIPKAFSVILTRSRLNMTHKAYRASIVCFVCMFLFLSITLSGLLYFFSHKIACAVGVMNAVYGIRLMAPAVLFSAMSALCRGYLLSIEKILYVAISESIEAILKLTLGLYFIFVAQNKQLSLAKVSAYATGGVLSGAFASFLFLIIIIIICKKQTVVSGKHPFSLKEHIVSVIKIVLPLLATSLLYSITSLLDLSLINKCLVASGIKKEQAIAFYGNYSTLVIPLISFVTTIASAFCLSVFPSLTNAFERKEEREFSDILQRNTPLVFIFSVFVSLGFYFFGDDYFSILFPLQSVTTATSLLRILSPTVVFIAMTTLFNTALEARGHTLAPLITMGSGIVVKYLISYILIMKYGVAGSALSTVISYAISFFTAILLMKNKVSGQSFKLRFSLKNCIIIVCSFSVSLLIKNIIIGFNMPLYFRVLPILICCLLFLLGYRMFYCMQIEKCRKCQNKQNA